MMSSVATITFGVTALLLISSSRADMYPGPNRYHDICVEIFNNVNNDNIPFKHLYPPCSGCRPILQTRAVYTKRKICEELTIQHNSNVASYLGGVTITIAECEAAFTSPDPYGPAEWNKWAGKHCGTWKNVNSNTGAVSQVFIDNALWHPATTTYDPVRMETFHKQEVDFQSRQCCNDGWNESGGSVSL